MASLSNKWYYLFIGFFTAYLLTSILGYLDFLNWVDWAPLELLGMDFEMVLLFILPIVFLLGVLLGIILLLKADENFEHLKSTKIITFLFFLLSPFLVYSFIIFQELISGNFLNIQEISPWIIFEVVSVIFMVAFLIALYKFDISFSKGKKVLFGVLSILLDGVTSFILFFIFALGMHDGGIS